MKSLLHSAVVNCAGQTPAVREVAVEIEITSGVGIHMVGMYDAHVKETLLRVITAMQSCGYRIPGRKIVIDIRPWEDGRMNDLHYNELDLPIALGILCASKQITPKRGNHYHFIGQLDLNGRVKPTICPRLVARQAGSTGNDLVCNPISAIESLSVLRRADIYAVDTLVDAVDLLENPDKRETYSIIARPEFEDLENRVHEMRGY